MNHRILHILILLIGISFSMASCVDDLLYNDSTIPDGESKVTATWDFTSFEQADLGTRAAGDSYDKIRNLCVLVYNEAGTELLESHDYDFSDLPINSNRPEYDDRKNVTFTLANGRYRIYAVANMGDIANDTRYDVGTVAKLKAVRLVWVETADDGTTIGQNDQMLGYFTVEGGASSADAADPSVVTITRSTTHLHAWLVRAASKVTVDFDGSQLYEDVTVHIKSLTIRDIPKECPLGDPNTPKSDEQLIKIGGAIDYASDNAAYVSKEIPYFPRKEVTEDGTTSWQPDPDSHSHTNANSLFFYENNQGVDPENPKPQVIEDKETGKLVFDHKDNKPYGTYIEVYAEYESTNPGRPGTGNVIYRFMLGKNTTDNYDAERNHHFKLTLKLRGYANDYDWHIDLEKFLVVPDPHVVDYQGYFFTPNWGINNLGQNFSQENDIIVESYEKNLDTGEKQFLTLTLEYRDNETQQFTETVPDWLIVEREDPLAADPNDSNNKDWNPQQKVKFRYKSAITKTFTVNEEFNNATSVSGPYNLAGATANAADNTANTYIVTAKGEYIFPLVYGNARSGGNDNTSAYTGFGDSAGTDPTETTVGKPGTINTLRNYKDEAISSPYILTDIYANENQNIPTNISASLVWEDQNQFVTGVEYVPTAYGGKGGIKFTVGTLTGGGANAVIALRAPDGTIMWSWQIWATYKGFVDEMDLNIVSPYIGSFNVMPVNLGWCSGGDEKILYWERHECEVKISNKAGFSRIIKVLQEPHLALPAGNSPYYQWGRKDPFVAATSTVTSATDVAGNTVWYNMSKKWWYNDNGTLTETEKTPDVLYPADGDADHLYPNRNYTKNLLGTLIQKPDIWFDPPCKGSSGNWRSADQTYANLWTNHIKTVYDPSPIGYQVSPRATFGVSVNGNVETPTDWFNVLPSRMYPLYNSANPNNTDAGFLTYRTNLMDFYTTQSKLISAGYPEVGYRDYDSKARVYQYGDGYIWYAEIFDNINAYYFRYWMQTPNYITDAIGSSSLVAPLGYAFYATDGFAVRPTKIIEYNLTP